jgi:hypothetical protein
MLRPFFFSVGMFVALWGGSFLMIDKMVLSFKDDSDREPGFRGMFTSINSERQVIFDPEDWAAFALMSVGSVTMLYSLVLPKRN